MVERRKGELNRLTSIERCSVFKNLYSPNKSRLESYSRRISIRHKHSLHCKINRMKLREEEHETSTSCYV